MRLVRVKRAAVGTTIAVTERRFDSDLPLTVVGINRSRGRGAAAPPPSQGSVGISHRVSQRHDQPAVDDKIGASDVPRAVTR